MKVDHIQVPAYYGYMKGVGDEEGFDALAIAVEGEDQWEIPLKPEYTLYQIIDSAAEFARQVYLEGYRQAQQDFRCALGISHE